MSKKIKAVIILSGEWMGKMEDNGSVVTVPIAFYVNVILLLGKKIHRNERFIKYYLISHIS